MPSQTLQQTYRDTVTAILTKLDDDAVRRGRNAWEFAIHNAHVTHASARICGNWLSLESAPRPIAEPKPQTVRHWLAKNRSLTGGARIALCNDWTPRVCADILLEEDVDITTRVREAYAGIRDGIHAVVNSNEADVSEVALQFDRPNLRATDEPAPPWVEHCASAGWAVSETSERQWLVTLDVSTAYFQAVISKWTDGTTRVCAELSPNERFIGSGLDALAVFLARTSYMLRFVRTSLAVSENGMSAWIETCFDSPPCVAEMSEAFAALSTACTLTHLEAHVLQSEEISDLYFASMQRNRATV